jgi:hypothetical protein
VEPTATVEPGLSAAIKKHMNKNRKEKKKRHTEGCTTPNPAPRTSASHPKDIHKIFPAADWGNCLVITLKKRELWLKRTCPGC